jgi:uncharacterized protein
MQNDRRLFLRQALSLAAAASLPSLFYFRAFAQALAEEGFFFVMGDVQGAYPIFTGQVTASVPGAALYSSGGRLARVKLPFIPHGFARSPASPLLFATFGKYDKHAAVFAVGETKPRWVVKERGRHFLGHGALSLDGKTIFATQNHEKKDQGMVGLFEATSGKRIGEIEAHGRHPHECRLTEKGELLVESSPFDKVGGNLLSWIDPASGKLLRQIPLDFGDDRLVSHFSTTEDGWVLCSGRTGGTSEGRPGLVAAVSPEGKLRVMSGSTEEMRSLLGETLSLAVDSSARRVAVTSPETGHIHVWNYGENKIEKVILAGLGTTGVAFEKESKKFYCVSRRTRSLRSFEAPSYQLEPALSSLKEWGRSSHLQLFYKG